MGLLWVAMVLSDSALRISFSIGKWFLDWQIFILRTILGTVFFPITVFTAAAREKQLSARLRALAVEYNALATLAGDTEIKLATADRERAVLQEKLELALQQRARFKQRYLVMASQVRSLEVRARGAVQDKEGDLGGAEVVPLMVPHAVSEGLHLREGSGTGPVVLKLEQPALRQGLGVEERELEGLASSGHELEAASSTKRRPEWYEEAAAFGGEAAPPPARRLGKGGGAGRDDPVLVLQQVPLTLDERRAAHHQRWEREREKVELEILGALRGEAQRACYACIALALVAALGAMFAYPGPGLPWGSATGLAALAVAMLFTLVAFGTRFPETASSAVWAFAAVWFLVGVVTAPGIPYALPFLPTFLQNLSTWLTDSTVVALIGQEE